MAKTSPESSHRFDRSWRVFKRLSWDERRDLAGVLVLLPATVASLRLLGFRRTQQLLIPRSVPGRDRQDLQSAQSLARIVYAAGSWSPLPANCLPRSMVLCRLLRRHGLAAELRLGVGKPGGRFLAHAWVEHGGLALADPGEAGGRFAAVKESRTRDAP